MEAAACRGLTGIVRDRSVMIALALIRDAAVWQGISIPRIKIDRFAIISNRVVDFLFSPVSEAAIQISISVLRLDLDDLGEIRDSKVVSALGLEDGTAV
jgi:hypothetical protein